MLQKRSLNASLGVFALGAVSSWASSASAHSAGLSVGNYQWREHHLDATVTVAAVDLRAALPRTLAGDGSWIAWLAQQTAVQRWMLDRLRVQRDEQPCPGAPRQVRLDGDGVAFDFVYECPGEGVELRIDAAFLRDLPSGHRHLAQLSWPEGQADQVLNEGAATLRAKVGGKPADARSIALAAALAAALVLLWAARRERQKAAGR